MDPVMFACMMPTPTLAERLLPWILLPLLLLLSVDLFRVVSLAMLHLVDWRDA